MSGFRPVVVGNADTGYQLQTSRPSTLGKNENNPRGYSVDMQQPLFKGFRVVNTVREAEATVRARRESLRTTEGVVLLDSVTAYVDVVRDQAIVRLRENNVTVLTRDLKATQDRFNVGEVTRTDVAQAQARRAASRIRARPCPRQPEDQPCRLRARDRPSAQQSDRTAGHPPGAWDLERQHRDLGTREPRPWSPRCTLSRPRATRSTASGASCCQRSTSRRATAAGSTRPASTEVDGGYHRNRPPDGPVLYGRRGGGARAPGQAYPRQPPAGDRAGPYRGAGTGGGRMVSAGRRAGPARIRPGERRRQPHRAGRRARGRAGRPAHAAGRSERRAGAAASPRSTWSPPSAIWWWHPMPCCRRSGGSMPRSWA